MHDIIPNNSRLYSIRLRDTPLCSTCGQTDTTLHRVLSCLGAREIWIWTRFRACADAPVRSAARTIHVAAISGAAYLAAATPKRNTMGPGSYGLFHAAGPPGVGVTGLYRLPSAITMEDVPVGSGYKGVWELPRGAGLIKLRDEPACDELLPKSS